MSTSEIIRAWLNWKSVKLGDVYTQDMLAQDSGVWSSSISDYMKGRHEPALKTIEKFARAFGVTVPEFWLGPDEYESRHAFDGMTPGQRIGDEVTYVGSYDKRDTVPLLASIPAGDWTEWMDSFPVGIGEEQVPRYGVGGEHTFAIRVKGDSMIGDGLQDGDILLCDPEREFTAGRGGRIGVVRWDGGYKIRRIYVEPGGEYYRLEPSNNLYEPEAVPVKTTTIFKIVDWRPNKEGMF